MACTRFRGVRVDDALIESARARDGLADASVSTLIRVGLAALADLHGRHAQQRHDDDECRDQRHNGPGLALGGSDDQHHGQQYGSMDESARVFGFGGQSLKLQHLDA